MKIDGRCYCGKVTFTSEVDPNSISVCHCKDCQVITGSAFRLSVAAKASDTQCTGTPKTWIKIADSGRRRRQGFCGECGTSLFACDEVDPQSYMLRVGTITQRDEFHPARQIWTESKLKWVGEILEARVESAA